MISGIAAVPFLQWPAGLSEAWSMLPQSVRQRRSELERFLGYRAKIEGAAALAEVPPQGSIDGYIAAMDALPRKKAEQARRRLRNALDALYPGRFRWRLRQRPRVPWPAPFQQAFDEKVQKSRTIGQSVSKFVEFLSEKGEVESLAACPGRELVRAFVARLEDTMTSGSATTYRLALREALAAIFPQADWEWLRNKKQWALPFDAWPASLREKWVASGIASKSAQSALGRLLAHWSEFSAGLDEPPTRSIIDGFVERIRSIASGKNVDHIISDLFYALAAVYPTKARWRWLRRRYGAVPARRHHAGRPMVLSLPKEAWPEGHLDRLMAPSALTTAEALIALLRPKRADMTGDRSNATNAETGAGRCWRPSTRDNVCCAYGLYLGTAVRAGLPSSITPEGLYAFVAECEARGSLLSTILSRCMGLYMVALAIAPESDWSWLSAICRRYADLLRAWTQDPALVHRTPARKYGIVVSAAEISLLGATHIADAGNCESDLAAAILFRDGLILRLLASAPMRVGTLATTDIGGHLRVDGEEVVVTFSWEETKEKRAEIWPLEPELAALIRMWIEVYRPRLTAEGEKALWVGLAGTRLSAKTISRSIAALTEKKLHMRIPAHRIRDCVASTIAERAPDKTNISRYILKHGSDGVTRIYDSHAELVQASRRFRAATRAFIEDVRRQLVASGRCQPRVRTIGDLHEPVKRPRRRRGEMPPAAPER